MSHGDPKKEFRTRKKGKKEKSERRQKEEEVSSFKGGKSGAFDLRKGGV